MSYVLSCSSTVDLTREQMKERDIHFICFHYQLDGKDLLDDMGASMSMADFYKAMDNGADTRTSQINMGEYLEYFEGFLKQGLDILHLSLSSGISGTVNSARQAAELLKKKYPERTVNVVDSLAASSGYGLLMDELADRRDEGMNLEEITRWAEENRLRVNHWFFSTDLKFYIKGGRVSKTSGMVGQLLNICPLLNVDYLGRLIPRDKIRTKRKVIHEIEKRMEALADDRTNYTGKCYISHSACYADARAVADLIEAAFPKLNGKVRIYDIGTTIGSHTGPGTVALFFMGDVRKD